MENNRLRKPNRFNICIDALTLAQYVFHITDNENTFFTSKAIKKKDGKIIIKNYTSHKWTISKLREQAHEIYVLISGANEINLSENPDPEFKELRLSKQVKAIELCNEQLALIQLCKKEFHLKSKRVAYWIRLVLKVRNSAIIWHMKNKQDYGNIV